MHTDWQTFPLSEEPPAVQGLYVIERPGMIEHVGQTDSVLRRRQEHLRDRPYLKVHWYTAFLHVLPVWSTDHLDGLETYLVGVLDAPRDGRLTTAEPIACPLPSLKYLSLRIAAAEAVAVAALQAEVFGRRNAPMDSSASAPPKLGYVEAMLAAYRSS